MEKGDYVKFINPTDHRKHGPGIVKDIGRFVTEGKYIEVSHPSTKTITSGNIEIYKITKAPKEEVAEKKPKYRPAKKSP